MEKLYDRIIWRNNNTPALNESNLNSLSKAVDDIDDRVIEIAGDVMTVVPQIQAYLEQADDLVDALETLTQNPPYIGANGNWYVWDTETQAFVDSGVDASITVEIADITMLEPGATPYVTNTGTDSDPIFHLYIPRGQTGQTGATGDTPNITASATIDSNVGTPSVSVTQGGTAENPTLAFAFSNLKGQQGATGQTGQTGPAGADGADGVSPEVTITSITGGHQVKITDADHPSGQTFNVLDGTGAGDMLASDYDANSAVKTAGGIAAYVSGKADKVTSATNGNFASLDSNGNLADSGHKHSDYLTSHQDISGKADKVSNATNNVLASLDSNGNLKDSGYMPYSFYNITDSTSSGMRHYYESLLGTYNAAIPTYYKQNEFFETSTKTTSSGIDTFAFQSSSITSDSAFDVYADVFGVSPTSVAMTGSNSVQVKFNSSDNVTSCRIYIK